MFLRFQGKGAANTLGCCASTGRWDPGEARASGNEWLHSTSSLLSLCYCCACWEVRGWVMGVDWQSCLWFVCECQEGMHSSGGDWWYSPCVLESLATWGKVDGSSILTFPNPLPRGYIWNARDGYKMVSKSKLGPYTISSQFLEHMHVSLFIDNNVKILVFFNWSSGSPTYVD